jgi:ABC-type branched-subunit amino acid transport system ATPase component
VEEKNKILEIRNVTKKFGGISALDNISVDIANGEIHSIIGPNGAGKTTLFNVINGMLPVNSGEIVFKGSLTTGLKPHAMARMGMGRTFQNISLFPSLTVLENVMLGAFLGGRDTLPQVFFRRPFKELEGEKIARDEAHEVLMLLKLGDRCDLYPQNLSYPEQKRLEIGRTLCLKPDLVLLDEPGAGLNPNELDDLSQIVYQINGKGITVVLIEHNIRLVMNISQIVSVLNFGHKIAEGSPVEIQNNKEVIEAYLGQQ